MILASRPVNPQKNRVSFDPDHLGRILGERFPGITLLFLTGSSQGGVVKPESDLDLALLIDPKTENPDLLEVIKLAENLVPDVRIDPGILNGAEPVYRFEALKGRLIFCRDKAQYQDFYSLTCREYEDRMIRYERQRVYRKEALSVTGP